MRRRSGHVRRDLCVIFGYRDPAHFYYAHFSASSDEVHNIIGRVDGGDRVRISSEPPGRSVFRLTDRAWHEFRVVGDGDGDFQAFLDDMNPAPSDRRDPRFSAGRVGVRLVRRHGAFDDLKLRGTPAPRR